jgi:hypothetical protein
VARTVLPLLLAALLVGSPVAGFVPAGDQRLIAEAIGIGQSRTAVRTRYHQPYRVQVARPPIDYIEIVTPFRRVVLLAEERARLGSRLFGQREAMAALGDRSDVVEVLVEATFHPLNVYVGVPEYDVELVATSPVARITPRNISRVPRYGARVEGVPYSFPFPAPNLPGGSQPLTGGTIAASFDAGTLNPNGVYEVVVSEKGTELARAPVNLGQFR